MERFRVKGYFFTMDGSRLDWCRVLTWLAIAAFYAGVCIGSYEVVTRGLGWFQQ